MLPIIPRPSEELKNRLKEFDNHVADDHTFLKIEGETFEYDDAQEAISRLEGQTKYIPTSRHVTVDIEYATILHPSPEAVSSEIKTQLVPLIFFVSKDIKAATVMGLILFVLGLISLTISAFVNSIENAGFATQETWGIVSWILVWTAAEKLLFDRQSLVIRKRHLERLYSAEYKSKN